jgi:hypothetical protein
MTARVKVRVCDFCHHSHAIAEVIEVAHTITEVIGMGPIEVAVCAVCAHCALTLSRKALS